MNGEILRNDERQLLWLALGLALLAATFFYFFAWTGAFKPTQQLTGQLPGWLWQSLTSMGDERVLLALLLPFCRRYPKVFWSLVVATLLGSLASRGIKVWLDMPRPAGVLGADEITVIGMRLTRTSFPSGHSVSAFVFAAVWLAMLGWRKMWPLLLLAVLVGLSRVAVGAHWPFDVLGGAVLGVFAAWVGIHVARHWRWGLRIQPHRTLVCIAAIAVATLPFDGQGYPGSLALRIAVCLWGLAGFAVQYLLPLLRGGWRGQDRFEA